MNHWKRYWMKIPFDCDEAINTMKVEPMPLGESNAGFRLVLNGQIKSN